MRSVSFMTQHLLFVVVVLFSCAAYADDELRLSSGETLYLPIYSHIYHGDLGRDGKPSQTLVSAHISIRNTDPRLPIRILSARYYDTNGKLLKEYLSSAATVTPFGTLELFVPRTDASGGSGANFVIDWKASAAVNPPLVEALHADIREARTLFFSTTARPIKP